MRVGESPARRVTTTARARTEGTHGYRALWRTPATVRGGARRLRRFLRRPLRGSAEVPHSADLRRGGGSRPYRGVLRSGVPQPAAFRGTTDAEAAGWLYRIAKRQLARCFKQGRAEREACDRLGLGRPDLDREDVSEIEQFAELDELRAPLRSEVSELSPAHRDALRLRILEELPYPKSPAGWRSRNRRHAPASRGRCGHWSSPCSTWIDSDTHSQRRR
jgi:hypothetical protein